MERFGIDISKWQGANFNIASTGAEFVIIKAGGSDDGLYIDSQFLNFYTQAKNLGLDVGIYWYTKAANIKALKEEINYLLSKIKGLQFELPVYLDIEEECLYNYSNNLAVTWIKELLNNGYYPGIYCGYYWSLDKLTDPIIGKYPFWLALWRETKPSFKWDFGIWQQGHKTCQGGVKVDVDYQFIDYSFIKKQGYNGFKKQKTYTDVKPGNRPVEWATEAGIVQGYPDGTFRPKDPCTREQVVTMLWRMAGKP